MATYIVKRVENSIAQYYIKKSRLYILKLVYKSIFFSSYLLSIYNPWGYDRYKSIIIYIK